MKALTKNLWGIVNKMQAGGVIVYNKFSDSYSLQHLNDKRKLQKRTVNALLSRGLLKDKPNVVGWQTYALSHAGIHLTRKTRKVSPLEERMAVILRSLTQDTSLTFEREYKFHPTRNWRADFAIVDLHILIEVEGGVFSGGRHTRGVGFTNDCEKYNEAALHHWMVLRFTGEQIKNGMAWKMIERAIEANS